MPVDIFSKPTDSTMANMAIGATDHLTVPHWALPNSLRSITGGVITGGGWDLALAPIPKEHYEEDCCLSPAPAPLPLLLEGVAALAGSMAIPSRNSKILDTATRSPALTPEITW